MAKKKALKKSAKKAPKAKLKASKPLKKAVATKPKPKSSPKPATKVKSKPVQSSALPLIKPIDKALLSLNSKTAAENYDEFQHDWEITDIIKENPASILRVDMAHCNPGSLYDDPYTPEALHFAEEQLAVLRGQGLFKEIGNFYYVYQIKVKARPGKSQIGLGAYVNTRQIWDERENAGGKIIRNEAIFAHKAEGRAKLIQTLRAIIGTVNLAAPDPKGELEKNLRAIVQSRPKPDVESIDRKGDTHQVWVVNEKAVVEKLTALYRDLEVYVADGNHRSKAAQMIGLPWFLAVIFCGETMNIDPYHRLLADLPFAPDFFIKELKKQKFKVTPLAQKEPFHATKTHQMGLYVGGKWYLLEPEQLKGLDTRSQIDAQLVEDRIVRGLLGMDPGDKRIAYVGGDYSPAYLQKQVDEGKFAAALSMPSMTMKEFYGINQSRMMLPRKTTWFTPKVRSGMIIGMF